MICLPAIIEDYLSPSPPTTYSELFYVNLSTPFAKCHLFGERNDVLLILPSSININEHIAFDNVWGLIHSLLYPLEIRWGISAKETQWLKGKNMEKQVHKTRENCLKKKLPENNASTYSYHIYGKKFYKAVVTVHEKKHTTLGVHCEIRPLYKWSLR